jgi:hypothetical protein
VVDFVVDEIEDVLYDCEFVLTEEIEGLAEVCRLEFLPIFIDGLGVFVPLRQVGLVEIPQEAFMVVLKLND